jgi:Mlc titration factor MtfA (ptsG expression regulator)
MFLVSVIIVGGVVFVGVRHWYKSTLLQSPDDAKEFYDEARRLEKEISKNSHYYQLLLPVEREQFMRRAWIFYKEKQFVARGFESVSFHMRAVISSYAAQITFGLPDVRLKHFRTIVVYREQYRSTITRQWHKGETHRDGAIVFSWTDLAEGHNNTSDGINLALHELAHALHLENIIINGEHDFLDKLELQRFRELAELEIANIKRLPEHFLRNYGATNDHEFFAVCVESFFERPDAFRKELPHVYETLSRILMQDPSGVRQRAGLSVFES